MAPRGGRVRLGVGGSGEEEGDSGGSAADDFSETVKEFLMRQQRLDGIGGGSASSASSLRSEDSM